MSKTSRYVAIFVGIPALCIAMTWGLLIGLPTFMLGGWSKIQRDAQACTSQVELTGPAGPVLLTGTLTLGGQPLDKEQQAIAKAIIGIAAARKPNFPTQELQARASIIAISAGATESRLHNLDYGDRDSLGLFQMRPSAGWGTVDQVTNVTYAINKFFNVMLTVKNWKTRPPGDVAQAVERSAYPDRYAYYVPEATRIVAQSVILGDIVSSGSLQDILGAINDPENCSDVEDAANVSDAVKAAESKLHSAYVWAKPPDGASFVAWAFGQADITVPSTLNALVAYRGDTSHGVTATWVDRTSIIGGSTPLKVGDIVFVADNPSNITDLSTITRAGIVTKAGSVKGGYTVDFGTWIGPDAGAPTLTDGNITTGVLPDTTIAGALRLTVAAGSGSWINPLKVKYMISCNYGYNGCGVHSNQFHAGIDMAPYGGGVGSDIYAAHAGKIVMAGYDVKGGNMIIINNGDGTGTMYAHMIRFASGIHPGVAVKVGQVIGYVGATGNATGPHLHFEVCTNGTCAHTGGTANSGTTNPVTYLKSKGVNLAP